MPVKITKTTAEYFAETDSRFDAAVRRLAADIRQLREDPARRSTAQADRAVECYGTSRSERKEAELQHYASHPFAAPRIASR